MNGARWIWACGLGCGIACGGSPAESDSGASTSSMSNADDDGDGGSATAATSSASQATASATGDGSTAMADTTSAMSADTGGSTAESTATLDGTGSEAGTGTDTDVGSTGDTGSESEGSSGDTGQEVCTCAANTDLIYVLSDDAELWSFDPATQAFALVGSFVCNGQTSTFSMGVDRNGIAWVMFQDQDIHTIDVNNPAVCVDPGYNPGQLGFGLFGMAFVSESAQNPCDQLYAQSYSGGLGFQEGPNLGNLGVLDPDTLVMSNLGMDDYDGGELTGTGDGHLYMFAGVNPAKLVELDKTDASVISTLPLATLELTNAFAFAAYEGDFYFFTESANPAVSQVTHLDYDDSDGNGQQDLSVVVDPAPIRIVGAGVSTCAPLPS